MDIDISKIMLEIKKEIKEKGLKDDMLSFNDAANQAFVQIRSNINVLNSIWNVQCHRDLGNGLGMKSKIFIFIKKVVRKMIKFYVTPIVSDQNNFNAVTTRTFNALNEFINEKNSEINELKLEIEKLKTKK